VAKSTPSNNKTAYFISTATQILLMTTAAFIT